jgi:hypothetical protein
MRLNAHALPIFVADCSSSQNAHQARVEPVARDPFARKIKIRKASDFNRRNGLNGRNRPSQNPDPHFLNGF